MRPVQNFIILLLTVLFFTNSCSVFSAEKDAPTAQFSSYENLLNEGNIQIQIAENSQEIMLTESQPRSEQLTVSPGTYSFEFSFLKDDTTQIISHGSAELDLEHNKNYIISFSSWKVDSSSSDYQSYGGCFECLDFTSFDVKHSALDSTSSLFNHRLLITFNELQEHNPLLDT